MRPFGSSAIIGLLRPDLVEADGLASALFRIPFYVGRKTEAIAHGPPEVAPA